MQADLPSDVISADVAYILSTLNSELNRVILAAHLQGLYSGVLALWQKSRPVAPVMVAIIIIVYIMAFASFSLNWSAVRSALVVNGENILTQITKIENPTTAVTLASGIMGALSTVLVDSIMMWRCWLVWGQRWQIVLLPALCLVTGIVCKIFVTKEKYVADGSVFLLVYIALTLATTLLCTLLVIYRVLAVIRATDGGGSGSRTYRRVIEVFIESAALYAVSLTVYVACIAHSNEGVYYLDPLAGFTRGIAPTMLLGRVAAGHARPDDSWKGSVMTSPLRFGQDKTEDESVVPGMSRFEDDFEAQPGNPREIEHSPTDLREGTTQDDSAATDDRLGLAGDDPEMRIVKEIR
ncbi:hypothetical protein IW262DRAFT_1452608 [Armillaria fumosa]|nr:hypothetical protein IW262DRAFT_1452608 [Armillaria fumosa]